MNLSGLSKVDKHRLREEYFANIEQPATETLDTFPSDSVTQVLDGKVDYIKRIKGLYSLYSKHFLDFQGFIVPHLLSVEECEEVIQMGEDWGIGDEDKRIRTSNSNRTNKYVNEELTIR